MQIIFLIFLGYTAKEVGKILKISFRTIENYTNNAKSKLGCYRKHEIVSVVLENIAL